MSWQEHIKAPHLAVTDAVSYVKRLSSERYFVWENEGVNDLETGSGHAERRVTGSTDLFTKIPHDPWAQEFEAALDASPYIEWEFNSLQYEDETGFFHHEWAWSVI